MSYKPKFRQRSGRCVEYLDKDGKWKSSGKRSKSEAMSWFYAGKDTKGQTLSEFADEMFTCKEPGSYYYLCQQTNTHTHQEWWDSNYGRYLVYIRPRFGNMPLEDIKPPAIQDWYIGLKGKNVKELAPATKKKIINCLSAIFEYAIFREIVDENPCRKIIKIKERNKGRKPYTEEELLMMFPEKMDKIHEVWGSLKWACFYLIMRDTGWRPGEIAGLELSGYYPEHKGIYTRQSIDSYSKEIQKSVKTSNCGYDYKVGLLSDFTCRALNIYIQNYRIKEGLLFMSDKGTLITSYAARALFRRRMAMLGIDTKGRPPYAIRTTFMTTAANIFSEDKVMELMGHRQWRACYDQRTPENVIKRAREL